MVTQLGIRGQGEVKNFPLAAAEDGSAPAGVYEGVTKNGIPWGSGGYCAYSDGREYLGEWKRGKHNGIGTHISANLDTYEGKCVPTHSLTLRDDACPFYLLK